MAKFKQNYPGNIVNNKFVATPKTRHSLNPSDALPLYEVPVASQEDVDRAVNSAKIAFKTWSKVPFGERASLLLQYVDLVESNRAELENLLVREQGKPLGLAKTEFDMTLGWLRAFAAMEVKDDVLDENDERTIIQTFPAIGVCCGIVPWNWPVLLGYVNSIFRFATTSCYNLLASYSVSLQCKIKNTKLLGWEKWALPS
jgi:acyl-CoA reductase-like NAD-dependent aldehyde dehydrogenase